MPDKVRLGILSTADIGRGRVISALRHCRNLEGAAVASRSLEKAQVLVYWSSCMRRTPDAGS